MKLFFTVFAAIMFINTSAQNSQNQIVKTVKDKLNSLNHQPVKQQNTRSHNSKPGHSKYYLWNVDEWVYEEDHDFTYDANGNLTEYRITDSLDNNYEHTLYTYTSEGWLKSILYQVWNSGAWENSDKTDYQYNDDGLVEFQASYAWNGTSWDTTYKMINLFDVQGNDSVYLSGNYNSNVWEIADGYNFINTYDGNDLLVGQIGQVYDAGEWMDEFKDSLVWSNDEVTEVFEQSWDGSNWQNAYRVYNLTWNDFEAGELTTYTYAEWNGGGYDDVYQGSIVYDGNGGYVETDQYYDGSAWVNDVRYTLSYDTHQNLTMEKAEVWQSTWLTVYKDNYNHTYSGDDLVQTITQLWDIDSEDSQNYSREDFSDFQHFTGVEELNSINSLALYPNPSQSNATLSYNLAHAENVSVNVYDQIGREVMTVANEFVNAGSHQVVLNTSQLATGNY
jgi:hypothetical protein